MLTPLYDLLGPSGANWVVVIVSGVIFLGLTIIVPNIVSRCRGRQGRPLL